MAALQKRLADHPAHIVSITSDPNTDTPEVLSQYADKIGADTDSWTFATSDDPLLIKRIGAEFFVAHAAGGHHSSDLFVVDRFWKRAWQLRLARPCGRGRDAGTDRRTQCGRGPGGRSMNRETYTQREPNLSLAKKLNLGVYAISFVVLLLVGSMRRIHFDLPDGISLSFLPAVHATLNSFVAILLVTALVTIKRGNVTGHKNGDQPRDGLFGSVFCFVTSLTILRTRRPRSAARDLLNMFIISC